MNLALIKAVGRMVLGAITLIGLFYLIANKVEMPTESWYVVFAVIGGLYGVDGILTYMQHKNGGQ